MLPRLKLIQCFTCKNNLNCWGLNEDIPLGKNEYEYTLTPHAMVIYTQKIMKEEQLCMGEQFGIFCMAFLHELRFDHKVLKKDVYQLISVLAALANTSNDGWVCPGEDDSDENEFTYEAVGK